MCECTVIADVGELSRWGRIRIVR